MWKGHVFAFLKAKRLMAPQSIKAAGRRSLPFLAMGVCAYWVLPWALPLPKLGTPEVSRVVYDRHGKVMRRLLWQGTYRHEALGLNQVPSMLVQATLAAEDKRFLQHGGIDFLALGRSLRDNLLGWKKVSGASTITQQIVKISSPPAPRTLWVKMREVLLARQLEVRFSKEQLLEMYLNRLDYGGMTRGCAAAARYYFQKDVAALSEGECLMLAGLPQAPSRLNPLRHPEAARRRQAMVIKRLAKMDPTRANALGRIAGEPLRFRPLPEPLLAPHAVSLAMKSDPGTGPLWTTLDLDLQTELETLLRNETAALASRNVHNAAAVVIDNASGEILALVGSSDFKSPFGGQVNGALRPRSAGSTLKPFTYALAFEKGAFPGDIVADVKARYLDSGGYFTPENYDRIFHGPMSLREALANSVNSAAVRLLNQVGGAAKLLETLRLLGFHHLDQSADHYGLGLTIGNAEVALLDNTNAYACIARLGEYRPWRILACAPQVASKRIFSSEACYLVADILSDNAARSPAFGAESALRFAFRAGSKTGTSSDFRDNWCMAFTPEFTVGVWMGNQNGSPMQGVSGVTGSATAAHEILTRLASRRAVSWYVRPQGIISGRIDWRTGHTVCEGQIDSKWCREELFRAGSPPAAGRPSDYDDAGRVLLADEDYAEWFRGPFNRFPAGFALRSSVQPAFVAPKVINPVSGSTFLIDPELPGSGRVLVLSSNLADSESEWSSPTLQVSHEGEHSTVVLVPGKHEITLRNHSSGATASATIRVQVR
jgi:penicillin-binding protein 1C